jgi:hypothetical protein
MAASIRRWGFVGLAAAVGGLLLVCGLAATVVDAQLRSDAATAAMTMTADQRRQLSEAGIADSLGPDDGHFRRMLILRNLSSGGEIPEHAFVIQEEEGRAVAVQWGIFRDGFVVTSWGGWQLKPLGILSFAGLAVIIGAVFAAAARWESRHPLG